MNGIMKEAKKDSKTLEDVFGKPIYVYTSEQAQDDGFLVGVAGNKHINFLTNGVYTDCIEPFIMKDIEGKIIRGFSVKALMKKLVTRIEQAIYQQVQNEKAKAGDWFYSVEASGWKFFVAENETGMFTVMFPSEY